MEIGIGYKINLPIYCGCQILLEIDSELNSLQHQPCIWVSYTLDTSFVVILFTRVWNLCWLLSIIDVHVKEVGFSFYRMRSKENKYNQTWMTSWVRISLLRRWQNSCLRSVCANLLILEGSYFNSKITIRNLEWHYGTSPHIFNGCAFFLLVLIMYLCSTKV